MRPAPSSIFTFVLLTAPVFGCGGAGGGEAGESETGESEPPPESMLEATHVATTSLAVCAQTVDDRVVCWGDNQTGQVGDGSLEYRRYPVLVDLAGVVQLEAGWHQLCARTQAGELYCWGQGEFGQLGDGVAEQDHVQAAPTQVVGLADVVDVSLSGTNGCAVLGDGSVWCWGENLGLGFESDDCGPYEQWRDDLFYIDTPCSPTPVQVPELTDAVEVAIGGLHQCARHQDGKVSCWGTSNSTGELGDGTGSNPINVEPRPVFGLEQAVQLEAGWRFSCALVADSSVWCWGDNSSGAVGQGQSFPDLPEVLIPTQIPGLTGVTQLAANNTSVCAVTDTGAALCWGNTSYLSSPQSGIGTVSVSPVEVDFGAAAVEVDTFGFNTCIVDVDSHVRCMGVETANGSADPFYSGDPVLWDG